MATILKSDWTGLNKHLIAKFFTVDNTGKRTGDVEVHAPLIDANLEMALNWQSPFENSSADQKAPALVAMLQSGAIIPFLKDVGIISEAPSADKMGAIEKNIREFAGRTGITKLNSTQIFTGMPPVKITGSLLFRAFFDAKKEVEEPFNQLMQWLSPQKLSSDSLAARGKGAADSFSMALLPSQAPLLLGVEYKGEYYAPMVFESVGKPLSSPIDKNGNYTELLIPISISSLTALDKGDFAKINSGIKK